MRRWTWPLGSGVVVVAFLLGTRSVLAEAPAISVTPIESAGAGNLFDHFVSPLGAAHSATQAQIQTVSIPPRKSANFLPHTSVFRPKPPNIHTRPKKKNKSWWPFGKK